jgi:hypothetical protein
MMWPLIAALAFGAASGPADDAAPAYDPIERLSGFPSVVMNHVEKVLGSTHLPSGGGTNLDPGVFVTLGLDRMYVLDHEALKLQQGRVADRTVAPECRSKCAAALYDVFQYEWLRLAVESSALATRVPQIVHFAAHGRLPATTLIEVAYAVSETRPAAPPALALLVNMPGRGLRALPFHLIPPEGLELQQGSAALGLTIEFGQGTYKIRASDPSFAKDARVQRLSQVRTVLNDLKKRYPNKQTVILVPDDTVSVEQLVQLVNVVLNAEFSRIVLSYGQEVYV